MFKRILTQEIFDSLQHNPAVAILGPRQIGKTTLAHEIAKTQKSVYLDLENPQDYQKLKQSTFYLNLHANQLIILDEVQLYPNLFMILRGAIDERRREGRGNGRFLILGSASNELLKQSSESLAGRIHYAQLCGLNPFEVEDTEPKALFKLWLRGGFPDSYSAVNDSLSHVWRQNFIRTYAQRDIPSMGPKIPASTLMRFWTMLAHAQGEQINASKLASALGVSSLTVSRYLDLMVDLLLVRRLHPWHGNVKKRLVKAPRIYVRDSGIVHALLQIPSYEALLSHPVAGKSWEGFVIEIITNALPMHAQPFFYRTKAGAEIDLVIEFATLEYWAVEVKFSQTPVASKGMHIACEDLKVKRKFIVYSGKDTFMGSNGIMIISLPDFLTKLNSLS